MTFPAQALAKGFVSLLDLNSGGRAPGDLSEQIVSIINSEPYYWLNKRERLLFGPKAAGAAAGFWSFNGVGGGPIAANEAMLVLAYTVTAVIPLGLTAAIAPAIEMPLTGAGGNQSFLVGPPVRNAVSALASFLAAGAVSLPFIIPPGSSFAGITTEISAATAFNANGYADVVRIRI